MGTVVSKISNDFRLFFNHGLGDCSLFAHALPLWLRRGHDVRIATRTPEDKDCLFTSAGVGTFGGNARTHPYNHGPQLRRWDISRPWEENKLAHNLTAHPMPRIGDTGELWNELLEVRLTLEPYLSETRRKEVDQFLEGMGQFVCLHTRGNTGPSQKNFTAELEASTYRSLLERTGLSLLLLDWDDRVLRCSDSRFRHMLDFRRLTLPELWHVIERSSLLIGVDSGPFHMTRFTDTPSVGVWFGHHPARFALPRSQTVNMVDGRWGELTSKRRHAFNLVERDITGASIAEVAVKLLDSQGGGCADGGKVVLDDVLTKLKTSGKGEDWNREPTFREVLGRLSQKERPVIVETGCVRQRDDWTAGFSTYVFGLFLRGHGGELHSVDLRNGAFAREWTSWTDRVHVYDGNSLDFLRGWSGLIDLLYLDSLDRGEAGHAEHCLAELCLALPHLASDGMVLIDDTPKVGGAFTGKGALAVPYLLERGWELHGASGYQQLLVRGDNSTLH